MKSKTLAIVGAGPGVGYAVASRFGREGYNVGLISRSESHLDLLVRRLADKSVKALGFTADVTDRPSLERALSEVKQHLGPIDVLEYSPTPPGDQLAMPRDITVENAQYQIDYSVHGAIASVQQVLPDMLARGDGGLLFCTAASARTPVPFSSNFAIAAAGLRSYVLSLASGLAADGIYAGILEIAGIVESGDANASGMGLPLVKAIDIAEAFWDMYAVRDQPEVVAGDEAAVHAAMGGVH
jgi:short-subunit dehydrogenase